jgi:hypothetical protein
VDWVYFACCVICAKKKILSLALKRTRIKYDRMGRMFSRAQKTNLHLLDLFPQRSTISSPVFAGDADFLSAFGHDLLKGLGVEVVEVDEDFFGGGDGGFVVVALSGFGGWCHVWFLLGGGI